ncbi:MAG: tRNA modification GTPase [Planctomycetota bacterium]
MTAHAPVVMSSAQATIAAIATPPGAGLRGVIRVSGMRARELATATWCGAPPPDFTRRGLYRGAFRDARGEQPLLLVWMPAPRSFTREDVAEFHLSGSPPLLAAALDRLLALGAELAQPGEFTRRAFAAGRIDLTQAEGVLALVEAASADEARAGLALLTGGLSQRIERLRDELDDLRALCEASLDFDPLDTGHVPDDEIGAGLERVAADLAAAAAWEAQRAPLRALPRVVLAGAPNAGKSSLFNALCRAELALVSDLPGTTRDVVAAETDCAGRAVELQDLAGFDAGAQGVDAAAQRKAADASAAADLVLYVVDASRADDAAIQAELARLPSERVLLVWSQIDRAGARAAPPPELSGASAWVAVSAPRGLGLEALGERVRAALDEHAAPGPGPGAETGVTRAVEARHAIALDAARVELDGARQIHAAGAPLELLAEHLRRASDVLDLVSGRSTPEDVLDRIFARFCLGK